MDDLEIPLEDILYVVGAWTLNIGATNLHAPKLGDHVFLLNSEKETIGEAIVQRYLSSRNPSMMPIEIEPIVSPADFKQVNFFRVKC